MNFTLYLNVITSYQILNKQLLTESLQYQQKVIKDFCFEKSIFKSASFWKCIFSNKAFSLDLLPNTLVTLSNSKSKLGILKSADYGIFKKFPWENSNEIFERPIEQKQTTTLICVKQFHFENFNFNLEQFTVHLKKRCKAPMAECYFKFIKVTLFHGCFSRFFKL